MGGISSSFQFLNYKIDEINLVTKCNLGVLGNGYTGNEDWQFQYGLTHPLYIKGPDIYIAGVNTRTILGEQENPDVSLFVSITGIFKLLKKGNDGKDIEQNDRDIEQFVKAQMPAILSPYLRTTITNILSMAGFGQVIPPLVNFREMAKNLLNDKPIIVQDADIAKTEDDATQKAS